MTGISHINIISSFSFISGYMPVPKIVETAQQLGLEFIGLADNILSGCVDFTRHCTNKNIKPIIGIKINIRFEDIIGTIHVIFKNIDGYYDLISTYNKKIIETKNNFPVFDLEEIPISKNIYYIFGNYQTLAYFVLNEKGKEKFNELIYSAHNKFFNNLYFAYTTFESKDEQDLHIAINEFIEETDIKINKIPSYPVVLKAQEDMNISITLGNLRQEDNTSLFYGRDYYMRSQEELKELYKDIPKKDKTNLISMVKAIKSFTIYTRSSDFISEKNDARLMVFRILYKNLIKHINDFTDEIKKIYLERLLYELSVYSVIDIYEILYIVYDFMYHSRENKMPLGPGRGSCVGSLVVFLLEITMVDPISHQLYFERFINLDRYTMPDIDIDICKNARGSLIQYIMNKYDNHGGHSVVFITVFLHLSYKAAFKEIARHLYSRLNFAEVNNITKTNLPASASKKEITETIKLRIDNLNSILEEIMKIENDEEVSIENKKQALIVCISKIKETLFVANNVIQKIEDLSDNSDRTKADAIITDIRCYIMNKILAIKNCSKMAEEITNCIKGIGVHAAGILITNINLDNHVPLFVNEENNITIQHNLESINHYNIFKFDILGLENLTIIDEIYFYSGVKRINFNKVIENKGDSFIKVYELMRNGFTRNIFQIDGFYLAKVSNKMKIGSFDDIVALTSLNRPGSSDSIPQYIENKLRWKSYCEENKHDPILKVVKDTYGVFIFQEQIMQISTVVARYSLKEADILRYAAGKKNLSVIEAQKEKFYSACREADVLKTEEQINKIFSRIQKFAGYAFNKSHAVAYSYITLETLYLKCFAETWFYSINMNHRVNTKIKVFLLMIEMIVRYENMFIQGIVFEIKSMRNVLFSFNIEKRESQIIVQMPLNFVYSMPHQHVEEIKKITNNSQIVLKLAEVKFSTGVINGIANLGYFRKMVPSKRSCDNMIHRIELLKKATIKHKKLQNVPFFDLEQSFDFPDIEETLNYDWFNPDNIKSEVEYYGFSITKLNIVCIVKFIMSECLDQCSIHHQENYTEIFNITEKMFFHIENRDTNLQKLISISKPFLLKYLNNNENITIYGDLYIIQEQREYSKRFEKSKEALNITQKIIETNRLQYRLFLKDVEIYLEIVDELKKIKLPEGTSIITTKQGAFIDISSIPFSFLIGILDCEITNKLPIKIFVRPSYTF